MYALPKSIEFGGTDYAIRNGGDFRTIIDGINALNDTDLTNEERGISFLIIFYADISSIEDIYGISDAQEAIDAAIKFINLNDTDVGYKSQYKLLDWSQDEQLVVSAINNVAKTEIRALPYMHWWTFIGYYMGIGDCALANVISIRKKLLMHKKLEKHEQEFRRQNPQYFTWKNKSKKDEELEKRVDDMWNKQ